MSLPGSDRVLTMPALIGRECQISQLIGLAKGAMSDRRGLCLITGAGGIGKSRLLTEFVGRARRLGMIVLAGRAMSVDRGIAHASLRDIVGSPIDETYADLQPVRAELIDRVEEAMGGSRSGDLRLLRPPYTELADYIERLSLRAPTVVALDDGHLADEESVKALVQVISKLDGRRVVFIVAARDGIGEITSERRQVLGQLIEANNGLHIDLVPLDRADITAIIAEILGAQPNVDLVDAVFDRSGGVPFFAQEHVLALRQKGALSIQHGRVALADASQIDLGLVGKPTAVVLERVAQQPDYARTVAAILSVFQRVSGAQLELVRMLSGLDAGQLGVALDRLEAAAIVVGSASEGYEFAHPLIAEAIYQNLDDAFRQRIHRAILVHLESNVEVTAELSSAEISLRSWHAVESAQRGDLVAIRAACRAASAVRFTAPRTAAQWYQRALDLLPADSPLEEKLLAWQAAAYWQGSLPERAVDAGLSAISRLKPGYLIERTRYAVLNAMYAMCQFDVVCDLVDEYAPRSVDPVPMTALKALAEVHRGNVDSARELAGGLVDRVPLSAPANEVLALTYLGHVENWIGTYSGLQAVTRRFELIESDELGQYHESHKSSALESAVYINAVAGNLERARYFADRIEVLLDGQEPRDLGAQTSYAQALLTYYNGSWSEALQLIRSRLVDIELSGIKTNAIKLRLLEARLLLGTGRVSEVSQALDESMQGTNWPHLVALREVLRIRTRMIAGDAVDGIAALRDLAACGLARGWNDVEFDALHYCLVGLYEAGRADDAAPVIEQLRQLAARTAFPRFQGVCDLHSAMLTQDITAAQRALTYGESQGDIFVAGRARVALAAAGVAVAANLERAVEIFESLPAPTWLARARHMAESTGVPLRRNSDHGTGAAQLTDAEMQLAQLVRQGLTNREIAETLHYSRKTVETYLTRLYRKTGIKSRVELSLALERGDVEA